MSMPFLWIGVSFSLGIIVRHYCPGLASGYFLAIAVAAGVGVAMLWFLRGTRFFFPVFLVLIALTGAFRAHLDDVRAANTVENFISPYRVEIKGTVANQPDVRTRGRRVQASFTLKARTVRSGPWRYRKEKKTSGNVRIFWIQPGFIPEKGDTIALSGRLERPRGALNPGEFDHAKYLAEKSIFTVLQPIGRRSGRLTAKASPWSFGLWTGRARSGIAALLARLYPFPQAEILKALVVGVRSNVPPAIQNAFMKTGTVHLLAISGLNITMIAGSFFLIFLALRVPRKLTAALSMMIVAVYMPLAGFGLPVQRAGLMALMVLAAVLMGRPAYLLNALCASFFLLLWLEPKSLWNIGFQLSFLSVFSLIAVLPLLPGHKLLPLSIGGSLAVLAGTSPVVLYYFNTFSPVGMVANIVAIPLFDAALFTALFAALFHWMPLAGNILISLSLGLVTVGLEWVRWLSLWRAGYWFFVKPGAWQLWAYYGALGTILILGRIRFPMKKAAMGVCVLCWAVAAVSMFRTDDPHRFRLTVLAAGREPILHVDLPDGAGWLVNTGRNFPSDQGERLVLPYLRQRGIKSLGGILLTDFRKKHCGGLAAILRDISVRQIVHPGPGRIPDDLRKLIREHAKRQVAAKKGARIGSNAAAMTVLEQNSDGMVILFEADPGKILFFSNAKLLEDGILERTGPDIIIVPFLNEEVLGRIPKAIRKKPGKLVLAGSVPGIFQGLKQAGIEYLDLTETGALTITAAEKGFFISSHLKGPV